MATGNTAQAAVAKLGADLMGDWSAFQNWYANQEPAIQAGVKQALADVKAAGSAVAGAVHSILPAPAPVKS
jgi:hypothetical protein